MTKNIFKGLVLLLLSFISFGAQAKGVAFQCQTGRSLTVTEKYLEQLGGEIQDLYGNQNFAQSTPILKKMMDRILCFYQIQGDVAIFEYLIEARSGKAYKEAIQLLSPEQKLTLEESLGLLDKESAE